MPKGVPKVPAFRELWPGIRELWLVSIFWYSGLFYIRAMDKLHELIEMLGDENEPGVVQDLIVSALQIIADRLQ